MVSSGGATARHPTGRGEKVLLPRNEVTHARDSSRSPRPTRSSTQQPSRRHGHPKSSWLYERVSAPESCSLSGGKMSTSMQADCSSDVLSGKESKALPEGGRPREIPLSDHRRWVAIRAAADACSRASMASDANRHGSPKGASPSSSPACLPRETTSLRRSPVAAREVARSKLRCLGPHAGSAAAQSSAPSPSGGFSMRSESPGTCAGNFRSRSPCRRIQRVR